MKNENDEKIKNVDRTIFDISKENEIFDSNEFLFILRDLKRNAHIERSSSNSQNFVDEKFENDQQFLNINEFRKIKIKNRSKNSKNKKKFQTRAKKKQSNQRVEIFQNLNMLLLISNFFKIEIEIEIEVVIVKRFKML